MRFLTLYILATVLVPTAYAGELLNSFVNEQDGHYIMHLEMRIDAEYDDVYAVLIDFDNLTEINDTIESSRLLETKEHTHKVEFVSNGCVWIICQTVKQVVIVNEVGRGYIMSETLPELSDMKYGRSLWQVIDEGTTTLIKYDSDVVPDFWIPPLIGPSIFQERILEEGIKTVNGIENIINNNAE